MQSATVRKHWPEYLIEATALGTFMVSACVFTVLLEHPNSPVHQSLQTVPMVRRVITGFAMGMTAVAIIRSRWGQRSGAHMNPAITLSYLTLGKVAPVDAIFYIVSQFVGGVAGVVLAGALIGLPLQDTSVNYAVTVPGPKGTAVAFIAEFAISLLMMTTVLWTSNSRRLARYTPYVAGLLVASFIMFESPFSGMSMNPARTVASALGADEWVALWIYFTAPPAAMLLATFLYRITRGADRVFCAKLHHVNRQPCIFNCRFGDLHAE